MKIKAAVVREERQPFVIDEIDLDEPRPNEVIVRVVSSGICHADLVTRDRYYGCSGVCPIGLELLEDRT